MKPTPENYTFRDLEIETIYYSQGISSSGYIYRVDINLAYMLIMYSHSNILYESISLNQFHSNWLPNPMRREEIVKKYFSEVYMEHYL